MRTKSKTRKFRQSVELYVNFKGLDFSKNENKIDLNIPLPVATGKSEAKVLVFAKDADFASRAKEKANRVILESEIAKLDKKEAARLADEFDIVLSEGSVMLSVGKYLGPVLAPKGKMPKIIPAEVSAIESALRQIKGSIRVTNKKGKLMPMLHCLVGNESFKNEDLTENVYAVYSAIVNALPGKQQNIKSLVLKLTMGPPIKLAEEAAK